MSAKRKRLGELLVAGGWISGEDLDIALCEQKETGTPIGRILKGKGVLTERTLLEALSKQTGMDIVDLSQGIKDPGVVSLLPYDVSKRYRALPLSKTDRVLHVAMTDPQDPDVVQALEFATGMQVKTSFCSEQEIDIAIEQYYGMEEVVERVVKNVTREARLDGMDAGLVREDHAHHAGQGNSKEDQGDSTKESAPIVRFVNLILMEAVRKEASDVHLEPGRHYLKVRFRLDGVLRRRMSVPKYLQESVLSRIKVMARMDIANKRIPQDGGIRLQVEGRRLDLRVSSLPTYFGEKIVIRLLDQTEREMDLRSLGLDEPVRKGLEECYRKPQGMILVTGPTGSGKSTTLQCILKDLRSEGTNIITVEDPMEYELEGINQVQINKEAGLDFAGSLRAILRQDPNVIMVGEIRDQETADVAFRAALTGHLVLSTLHTNDTVSTITRLVDMGVPGFLISSALLAVVSQRLVRKICLACREEDTMDMSQRKVLSALDPHLTDIKRGRGCSQCGYTGYKGRVGVYELLVLWPEIREAISRGASEGQVKRLATDRGMVSLQESGLEKVSRGITSLSEFVSVAHWEFTSAGEDSGVTAALLPGQVKGGIADHC